MKMIMAGAGIAASRPIDIIEVDQRSKGIELNAAAAAAAAAVINIPNEVADVEENQAAIGLTFIIGDGIDVGVDAGVTGRRGVGKSAAGQEGDEAALIGRGGGHGRSDNAPAIEVSIRAISRLCARQQAVGGANDNGGVADHVVVVGQGQRRRSNRAAEAKDVGQGVADEKVEGIHISAAADDDGVAQRIAGVGLAVAVGVAGQGVSLGGGDGRGEG